MVINYTINQYFINVFIFFFMIIKYIIPIYIVREISLVQILFHFSYIIIFQYLVFNSESMDYFKVIFIFVFSQKCLKKFIYH